VSTKWIIEARYASGRLDLTAPQPETVFGMGAIHGMTEDAIAHIVYEHVPGAVLTGDRIAQWPSLIDPRWVARRKTW
jgi:hypothetical protein